MVQLSTNSNNTYKMVRLESVLHDVYRIIGQNRDVTQDNLLESAASAMSHLYNYKLIERVMYIGAINNHTVVLPDFYNVEAVLYKPELTEEEYTLLPKTFQIDMAGEDGVGSSLNPCTVTDIEEVGRVSKNYVYNLKTSRPHLGWNFMTFTHSLTAQLAMGINECHTPCENSYTVKNDILTVSPQQGYVLVIVSCTPRDKDGHPMVPVIPMVNEALKSYILMEIHERNMNMSKDGAIGLFRLYNERWAIYSAAAIGELNKMTFPENVEMIKDMRYFRDDSPFRSIDKSSFEATNIGHTDRSHVY